MTTILGIFDGTHNSGAAIVNNGEILAASDTERFTRQKGAGGFPSEAISCCLKLTNLSLSEIDSIAFAGWINPNPFLRLSRTIQTNWQLDSGRFYAPQAKFSNWIQFNSPFPYLQPKEGLRWNLSKKVITKILRTQLRNNLGWNGRTVELYEHHKSHAATAHFGSGFTESLTVVADGIGDGISLSVWLGKNTSLQKCFELKYPHSLGLLYASITGFLGFKPFRHEGKLTGMSALGDAQKIKVPFPFSGPFPNRQFTEQFPLYEWLKKLDSYYPEDICAWLQKGVEREIIGILSWHLQTFGDRPIALSGGLFANVALNGRIAKELNPSDLFVFPNMGDGGLAVGAAYLSYVQKEQRSVQPINSMMLGSNIGSVERQITQFAKNHNVTVKRLPDED